MASSSRFLNVFVQYVILYLISDSSKTIRILARVVRAKPEIFKCFVTDIVFHLIDMPNIKKSVDPIFFSKIN